MKKGRVLVRVVVAALGAVLLPNVLAPSPVPPNLREPEFMAQAEQGFRHTFWSRPIGQTRPRVSTPRSLDIEGSHRLARRLVKRPYRAAREE